METKSLSEIVTLIKSNIKKTISLLNNNNVNIKAVLQTKVLSEIYSLLVSILTDYYYSNRCPIRNLIIIEVIYFLQIYLSHLIKEEFEGIEFEKEIESLFKIIFELYPKHIHTFKKYKKQLIFSKCIDYLLNNRSPLINEKLIQSFFENDIIYKEDKVNVIRSFLQSNNLEFLHNNESLLKIIFKNTFNLFLNERNLTFRLRLLRILFLSLNNPTKFTQQIEIYIRNNFDIINLFASIIKDKKYCNEYIELYISNLLMSESLFNNNDFLAIIELIKNNQIDSQTFNKQTKTVPYFLKNLEKNEKDKEKLKKNFLIIIKTLLKNKDFCRNYLNEMLTLLEEFANNKSRYKKECLQLCLYFFVYLNKHKMKFQLQNKTQELLIKRFVTSLWEFSLNKKNTDTFKSIFELFNIGKRNNSKYDIQLICNQIINEMNEDQNKENSLTQLLGSNFCLFINQRFIYNFLCKNFQNIFSQNLEILNAYLKTKETNLCCEPLNLENKEIGIPYEITNYLKALTFKFIIQSNNIENQNDLSNSIFTLLLKLVEFINRNKNIPKINEVMNDIFLFFEFVFKLILTNEQSFDIKMFQFNVTQIREFFTNIFSILKNLDKNDSVNFGKHVISLLCVFIDNFPNVRTSVVDFPNILKLVKTILDSSKNNYKKDFICLDNICKILYNEFVYIKSNDEPLIQKVFFEEKYFYKILNLLIQNNTVINNNKQFLNIILFMSSFYFRFVNIIEEFFSKPYSGKDLYQFFNIINLIPCNFNNLLNKGILNEIINFLSKLLRVKIGYQKEKEYYFHLKEIDFIKTTSEITKFYLKKYSSSPNTLHFSHEININQTFNSIFVLFNEIVLLYQTQQDCFGDKTFFFICSEVLVIVEFIINTINLTEDTCLLIKIIELCSNITNQRQDTFDKKDILFAKILWSNKKYQRILHKLIDIFFKSNMTFQLQLIMEKFFLWLFDILSLLNKNIKKNKWLRASFLENKILDLPKLSNNLLESLNQFISLLEKIEKDEIIDNIKHDKPNNYEQQLELINNNTYVSFTDYENYVNQIEFNQIDNNEENILTNYINQNEIISEENELNVFNDLITYLKSEKNIEHYQLEYTNLLLSKILVQFNNQYFKQNHENIIESFLFLLNLPDTICYKHTKAGVWFLISQIIITQDNTYIKEHQKLVEYIMQEFLNLVNHKEMFSNYALKKLHCISLCLRVFSNDENFVKINIINSSEYIVYKILYKYKHFTHQIISNCLEIYLNLLSLNLISNETVKDDTFKFLFTNLYTPYLKNIVILNQIFQIIVKFIQISTQYIINKKDLFMNEDFISFIINILDQSVNQLKNRNSELLYQEENLNGKENIFYENLLKIINFYLNTYQQEFIDKCIIKSHNNLFQLFKLLDGFHEEILNILILFKKYTNISEKSYKQIITILEGFLLKENSEEKLIKILDYLHYIYSKCNTLINFNDFNFLKKLLSFFEINNRELILNTLLCFVCICSNHLDTIHPKFSFDEFHEKLNQCFHNNLLDLNIPCLIEHIFKQIECKLTHKERVFTMFVNPDNLDKINESKHKCQILSVIFKYIRYYLDKNKGMSYKSLECVSKMLEKVFQFNDCFDHDIEKHIIKILQYIDKYGDKKKHKNKIKQLIISFLDKFDTYSYFNTNDSGKIIKALKPFVGFIEEINFFQFSSLLNNLFPKQNLKKDDQQDNLIEKLNSSLDNILAFAKICFSIDNKDEGNQRMLNAFDHLLQSILTLFDNKQLNQDVNIMNDICPKLIQVLEKVCLNNASFLDYLAKLDPKLSPDAIKLSFIEHFIDQSSSIIYEEDKFSISPHLSQFIEENNQESNKYIFVKNIHKKMNTLFKNQFQQLILDKDEKTSLIKDFLRKSNDLYFYSEKGVRSEGSLTFYPHKNSHYQLSFRNINDIPFFEVSVNWIKNVSQGINSEAFGICNRTWFNKPTTHKNCFVIYLEANCFDYEAENALSFEVEENKNLKPILDHLRLLIKGMSPFPRINTVNNRKT